MSNIQGKNRRRAGGERGRPPVKSVIFNITAIYDSSLRGGHLQDAAVVSFPE
jgi:hypothetical protein